MAAQVQTVEATALKESNNYYSLSMRRKTSFASKADNACHTVRCGPGMAKLCNFSKINLSHGLIAVLSARNPERELTLAAL